MKHLNTMKKMLLIGAAALMQQAASGQNLVKNHGFEDGPMPSGNGPYWVGQSWVDYWTGYNIQFPAMTYNTGSLADNRGWGFWDFPTGLHAYEANRSVNIALEYHGSWFSGSQVIGTLSSALGWGCYSLCINLSGAASSEWPQTVDNEVEVLVRSSWGGAPDMIVSTFTIPKSMGWRNKGKMFNISFSRSGKYDRLVVRLKQKTNIGEYINSVFIDDVSVTSCGNNVLTNEPARADFNYQVLPFNGGGGGGHVIADGETEENAVHYWELSYAPAGPAQQGEEPQWTVLTDNSFSTLDGHYESGAITGNFDPGSVIYKLDHLLFTACGSRLVRATDLSTSLAIASTATWVPFGNEYGDGVDDGGGNLIRKPKDQSKYGMQKSSGDNAATRASGNTQQDQQGSDNGSSKLFTFSPNPAGNELNVHIGQDALQGSAITIMNDKGMSVMSTDKAMQDNKLDLADLPKGIYYIRVITGDQVEIQKFVKQ